MTIGTAWAITAGCLIVLAAAAGWLLRSLVGQARVLGATVVGVVTAVFWFWVIQDMIFGSTDATLRALGLSLSANVGFVSLAIASKLARTSSDSSHRTA